MPASQAGEQHMSLPPHLRPVSARFQMEIRASGLQKNLVFKTHVCLEMAVIWVDGRWVVVVYIFKAFTNIVLKSFWKRKLFFKKCMFLKMFWVFSSVLLSLIKKYTFLFIVEVCFFRSDASVALKKSRYGYFLRHFTSVLRISWWEAIRIYFLKQPLTYSVPYSWCFWCLFLTFLILWILLLLLLLQV